MKRILIACEESQAVCKAFRLRGFEAYSCDIQDCSGGHPEWHIKGDVLEVLNDNWDMVIAHPPCTYLSNAGAAWLYRGKQLNVERYKKGLLAKDFFMKFYNLDVKHLAIENPIPSRIYELPKHTQQIQPYHFGHPYSKATRLWLKNLPELKSTNLIDEYSPFLPSNTGGKKRNQSYKYRSISQKQASKTFEGIADAMAEQWGNYILNQ